MDANERLHNEWIVMAQPEGLVVTTAALKAAEANITWPVTELQAVLEDLAGDGKIILDLRPFLREVLGWSDGFVVAGEAMPASLRVHVEGGDALAPTLALRSADDADAFVLLVTQVGWQTDLDAATDDKRWTATAHQRFERLLRETGVHVGLLTNGKAFRLVYAPKRESAGWVTFRLHEMLTVDGRPLLGALHMLLNERRLLSLEEGRRLSGLLKASREYQNTVSNKLREQVLAALRELLVGFQNADRLAEGAILHDYRGAHLQEVYSGLVTVLMRMVFVLYAEEQGLLPIAHDLYASSYSLTRLHAQLQDDKSRFGDTINDRYGAWARVISLFRLLHDGVVAADGLNIPARRGDFFNPDAFHFLEGRPRGVARQLGEVLDLPRISDGVLFCVLDKLLVLAGERLQYKGLDVEQIGSVYEGLMGFELEVAEGDSLAFPYKVKGRTHADVVVNLELLTELLPAARLKHLKDAANLDLSGKIAAEVRQGTTVELLHRALSKSASRRQPGIIPKGSLFVQPGEERRKSGSHYTPKSLTAPIVQTALRPILERLGQDFKPEEILDLKICDPAMGSGAFLVEACRQLADLLVAAWRRTNSMPDLPPDELPLLHACRLIAQRCLYGVDKNPLAVDLARLSMWLVTFAKEHPFTFVDHALRCGDSLVGLSKEQIANLTLDVKGGFKQIDTVRAAVLPAVQRAEELRRQIHSIGDPPDTERLVALWRDANEALHTVRMLGDLVVAAFFLADTDKARKKSFDDLSNKVTSWLATGEHEAELKGMVADLREGERPTTPFHWEVEFPEIFSRENPGFDCFVGNPPFLGGSLISGATSKQYLKFLNGMFPESGDKMDLVAYFFRRTYELARNGGCIGLIATNTISQGDTRAGGLGWICSHQGHIYAARRRMRWPGEAKVVVSCVHLSKAIEVTPATLDGSDAPFITAYLFDKGTSAEPAVLRENQGRATKGVELYAPGFVFADGDEGTSPIALREALIRKDEGNAERIRPYLGGDEVNDDPEHRHRRWVISFDNLSESEAKRWEDLFQIVKEKVRPYRLTKAADVARWPFWQFWRSRAEFYLQIRRRNLRHMLVCSRHQPQWTIARVGSHVVCSDALVLFAFDDYATFGLLQSRVHETWARFFASTLEDRLRYTSSDCFDTFPFPIGYAANGVLEAIGTEYHEFRAAIMVKNKEGMTKTYNRLHEPEERSAEILKLRDLHAQLDRAVLDAYGWMDVRPVYDFREQVDESVRLTWADETRDEVLARLLELNRVMAENEARDAASDGSARRTGKRAGRQAKRKTSSLALPGMDPEDK